jgi:hypothetical protein
MWDGVTDESSLIRIQDSSTNGTWVRYPSYQSNRRVYKNKVDQWRPAGKGAYARAS